MDDTTRANGYKHGRPEGRDVKPADEIVRKVIEALPAEARLYPDVYAWQVTDALEAATSAPAVDRREFLEHVNRALFKYDNDPAFGVRQVAEYLAAPAPAIDREALARLLNPDAWVDERDEHRRNMVRNVAGQIIASGLLRDVRDVQAETLERVREEIRALACWADPVTGRSGFNLGNDEDGEAGARMAVLDILAQAIREARSER